MKTILNYTLFLLISSAFIISNNATAQQHLFDERTIEKLQNENLIKVSNRLSETHSMLKTASHISTVQDFQTHDYPESGEVVSLDSIGGGYLMYEMFDYPAGQLPPGWTITGSQVAWSVNVSAFAGGQANELRLIWAPPMSGISRLVTYPISIGDQDFYRFRFKQMFDSFPGASADEKIAIDISFDGGETWEILWEHDAIQDIPAAEFQLPLSIPAQAATMHLGFRFEGNTVNIDHWYLDDMIIEPVLNNDLAGLTIDGSSSLSVGLASNFMVNVRNNGSVVQDNYSVKLMKNGVEELASVSGNTIAPGEIQSFEIAWSPPSGDVGILTLSGYVEFAGDEFPANNYTSALNAEVFSETMAVVEIGDGSFYLPLPYSFVWHHSLSQTLYYPDEIGFSIGDIVAISYANNFFSTKLDKEITIWMGETTEEDLINGWIDPSTLQLVFDGTVDFPAGINDVLITLDQPYNYNGGNLVIYSHKSDDSWNGDHYFRNSIDENRHRTRRSYRDFLPFDPLAPPDASSSWNYYPNITMFLNLTSFGSVEGIVTDGTNLLEGVNVTISNSAQSALTNADGEYSLPTLMAGTYAVQFALFGYEALMVEEVIVEEDSVTILNAVLTPIPQYTVTGSLEDSDGNLIEGATINLSGYANYEVLSDEYGVFSFSNVYESVYTLDIVAFGYEPFSQAGLEVVGNLDLGVILLEELPASFDIAILDFGMVPVQETRMVTVNITNNADALLMLFSFNTVTSYFYAQPATWAIQPGQSVPITVIFTPPSVGNFLDNLSVEYFYYAGSGVITLPLQGEGILLPPSNLTAEVTENTVNLSWLSPGSQPDMLRFGNGQTATAIGTSQGIYEFAARFTSTDLMPYYGKQLDVVSLYIHSTSANFTLKLYTGDEAQNLVLSLPLNGLEANEWNDIELPAPVPIENIDYLWLGYEINSSQTDFIAGVDGGPGVAGSGDLLRIDGTMWTTLYSYGFSNNWNIRGLLSDIENGDTLSITAGTSSSFGNYPETTLLGYNVYRDSIQLNTELVTGFTFSDEIEPGQAFLYGVTAVYAMGESMPATVSAGIPQLLTMPSGWEFVATPVPHNIHIPENVLQIGLNLQPGDMLGVFYDDNGIEKCAGAIQWNGTHKVLTAFGNDPNTFVKDGFFMNENLSWKVFRHQTATTHTIVATYDHDMPHFNGTFNMLGLSMLETIELGTVGIENAPQQSNFSVYPNPSSGNISLKGLIPGEMVSIFDAHGRLVFKSIAENNTLQINLQASGVYIAVVERNAQLSREKIIVY
jgi:hypothetical protein